MTLARIRFAFCSVVAALLAAAWTTAAGQGTPPGRETSAESVGSYALSQQMPVDPEVTVGTLPNGLRYYVRKTPSRHARRTPARHQSRIGARRRRPAGPGAFRRAHAVRGHAEFPAAGHQRVPGVARRRHRAGRERGDELRRNAVHAARADRRAGRPQPRDARARGLGAGRDVRSRGDRAERGIVLSEWRMHLGAGERTHGQAAAGAARRIALRRSIARSASPRSSSARSASSCCASIATGIARI